jgi:hypothetical protein
MAAYCLIFSLVMVLTFAQLHVDVVDKVGVDH